MRSAPGATERERVWFGDVGFKVVMCGYGSCSFAGGTRMTPASICVSWDKMLNRMMEDEFDPRALAARATRPLRSESNRTGIGFVFVLTGKRIPLVYVACNKKVWKIAFRGIRCRQMAESPPIPVRLSDDLIKRLDKVAERIGSNRASVMRVCTQTFVEQFERHGKIMLPPDWQELLARADNRTRASRGVAGERPAEDVNRLNDAPVAPIQKYPPGDSKPWLMQEPEFTHAPEVKQAYHELTGETVEQLEQREQAKRLAEGAARPAPSGGPAKGATRRKAKPGVK